ncbi:mitochondrial carrier [Atractiella rhizophila]|nr:mitochondrial carrier [Atractiella rhizophila]
MDVEVLLPASESSISPLVDFAAGTLGGIAGLVVGHPFDTVKVKLQCQTEKALQYRNAVGLFSEAQMNGLYKGIVSPLAGVALMNASVFGFYGLFLRLQLPTNDTTPTLTQVTIAGMACGLTTSFITSPMELFKILQQSSPPSSTTPSLPSLLYQLFPRRMWRGLGATMLRDLGYGPYFLAYESARRTFGEGKVELLLAGGFAGVVGWAATFPMDVVKTRIQSSQPYVSTSRAGDSASLLPHDNSQGTKQYRTVLGTIVRSYKEEGWRVFFRGLGATLLRSIPVNMATFAVYETCMAYFR